jgi:exodeoxyribonuclease VII small subunit
MSGGKPPGSLEGVPDDEELAGYRFEDLMDLLEELSSRISDGRVGLEEATELFERARTVYRMAGERLDAVRRRIDSLDSSGCAPEEEGRVEAGPSPSEGSASVPSET